MTSEERETLRALQIALAAAKKESGEHLAERDAARIECEQLKKECMEWRNAAGQAAAFLERSVEAAVELPLRVAECAKKDEEIEKLKAEIAALSIEHRS